MISWSVAWHEALYGADGFFLREAPAAHFRTNAHVPLFGSAVRELASRVDAALGFPDVFDVVDVGAGRGELLTALGPVPPRWRLTGVEVAQADVPFGWTAEIPCVTGLLIANEWLDSIPLQVLSDGREVLVDSAGTESLGDRVDSEWARRWWPSGGRVEVGAARDAAWATAVSKVRAGVAVAIDYGHTVGTRRPTLTGYRAGRLVPPVADGTCDLTAHVALDACATATGASLVPQHTALAALGVTAALPPRDAPSYAQQLERSSQAAELLDPAGLGGFGWLVQGVDVDVTWLTG